MAHTPNETYSEYNPVSLLSEFGDGNARGDLQNEAYAGDTATRALYRNVGGDIEPI